MKQKQLPIYPLMWTEIDHVNKIEKVPVFLLGNSLCKLAKIAAKRHGFDAIEFFFCSFFSHLIEQHALTDFERTPEFINIAWTKKTSEGICFLFFGPTLDNIANLWGKTVGDVQEEFSQQVTDLLMDELDQSQKLKH